MRGAAGWSNSSGIRENAQKRKRAAGPATVSPRRERHFPGWNEDFSARIQIHCRFTSRMTHLRSSQMGKDVKTEYGEAEDVLATRPVE